MAVHHALLDPLVQELNTEIRIAIIVADFNPEVTHKLVELNTDYLQQQWFSHIDLFHVPGAFELPGLTKQVVEKWIYNLVITIGCVIRWQTPHFEYICTECSRGLMDLSMSFDTPLIFWVLTCDTLEQALARIDTNYAIYGLNHLAHWHLVEQTLETRHAEVMQQVQQMLEKETN